MQASTFDVNRLYSSEILSILIQHNDDAKTKVASYNAIDLLLQVLAVSAYNHGRGLELNWHAHLLYSSQTHSPILHAAIPPG